MTFEKVVKQTVNVTSLPDCKGNDGCNEKTQTYEIRRQKLKLQKYNSEKKGCTC